jgi:predicted O-methyltransferase YrrM
MTPAPADLAAQKAELEAYLRLGDRLGLRLGLPFSRNWSAAPDFLELLAEHVLAARPTTIVECSCGLTTLVLARCCELNGLGRVLSLENGPEFAARTRAEIARYDLEDYARVIDAPLRMQRLRGEPFRWYDLAGLDAPGIDMLVIDGPPGFLQRHSRYPALPLLYGRLAPGCTVYLDDAARPDERESVAHWLAEFPALAHAYLATARGCSRLHLEEASRPGA